MDTSPDTPAHSLSTEISGDNVAVYEAKAAILLHYNINEVANQGHFREMVCENDKCNRAFPLQFMVLEYKWLRECGTVEKVKVDGTISGRNTMIPFTFAVTTVSITDDVSPSTPSPTPPSKVFFYQECQNICHGSSILLHSQQVSICNRLYCPTLYVPGL